MKSRTAIAVLSAATALLLLVGCSNSPGAEPSQTPTGDDDFTIAYGSVSESNPLFRSVGTNLTAFAEETGATVLTYDNAFDPAKALANTRIMIQQKPDVIVQWVPAAGTEAIGKLIAESGIPCIAVNVAIPGCPLFNLSNGLVGKEAGKAAAEEALKRGWTGNDTTVGLMSISIAGEEAYEGITEFYSNYAAAFPEMEQMQPEEITLSTTQIGDLNGVQVDSGGTLDSGYEATQRMLQIVPPERNLVIQTQNDDSARGAIRAVEQAGRLDSTIVASAGADEGAIEALRSDPSWVAEGDLSVGQWGQYIFAMSRAILDGVELPELTPTPQVMLTKDNIDDFYDGTTPLNNAPVPDGAEYLVEFFPN